MDAFQERYTVKALAQLANPDMETNFRRAGLYFLDRNRNQFSFYQVHRLPGDDPTAVGFDVVEYELYPFEYRSRKRVVSAHMVFVPERNCIVYNRLVERRQG